MKKIRYYFSFFLTSILCFGQTTQTDNHLSWSSTRKLKPEDFVIRTTDLQTSTSFAQFTIVFQVHGFDFMTKNFNKKVDNYFIKSASWINTTSDVNLSVKYQQTLFDICEIYTRQLRKELKENRKKLLTRTNFINELNAKAMTNFASRRIVYDTDTKSGSDTLKQQQWEAQIPRELAA